MGYQKDTFKGLTWIGFLRASTRVIAIIRISILARILNPLQFGIFGIASFLLAFLEMVTETGINIFFLQGEGDVDEYNNIAWVVSILRGLLMGSLIFITAPVISSYFSQIQAINIIRLISLVPIIKGFINPSIIQFQKNLQFNVEFKIKFVIFFVDSLVSILTGIITKSAYSLVYGLLAGGITEVLISWIFVKPIPVLEFNMKKIKLIFNRGKWVTAYGVSNYLFENIDNMIVGKIISTDALGLYQVTYKISMLPISEISDVFITVTLPIYSKISNDLNRLKRAFLRSNLAIMLLTLLGSSILIVFSKEIVLLILGEKWISAAPLLRILSLAGVIRALSRPSLALFFALKKQEISSLASLISLICLLTTIVPFIKVYGLIGAAYSVLTSSIIVLPYVFWNAYINLYNNKSECINI